MRINLFERCVRDFTLGCLKAVYMLVAKEDKLDTEIWVLRRIRKLRRNEADLKTVDMWVEFYNWIEAKE